MTQWRKGTPQRITAKQAIRYSLSQFTKKLKTKNVWKKRLQETQTEEIILIKNCF